MYLAISAAISAFAAELSGSLLLLNLLFLFPFYFFRRNYVQLVLIFLCAFISYSCFSMNGKRVPDSGEAVFHWQEAVKIDGGRVKGFAKLADGTIVYLFYSFRSEEEKSRFSSVHLPAFQFTGTIEEQEIEPPAHRYSFDMARYLRMNGAAAVMEASDITSAVHRGKRAALSEYRARVKAHIDNMFPAPLAVEAQALLIGDRSNMSDELQKEYRTLGITHLFAISGLHVGLLTFFIRTVLLRIGFRKEWVTLGLLLFLPLYAVIAGGAPSVWRAVTVTMLVMIALSGNYKLRIDDALAWSALGFIFLQPHTVFQPGFQLSYLAAFSLLYSSKILADAKNGLMLSFLVTVITQAALYPVLLYHFYELSISSFIANLLYVPLYSVFILPANIILLLFSWTPFAALLFAVYEPVRQWIGSATSWLASLPYQVWTPGQPDAFGAALAAAGIIIFLVALEKRSAVIAGIVCLLLPAFYLEMKPKLHKEAIVSYIDVGQGDSTVIELPYRKAVYVIDTGGTLTFGERNFKTPEKSFEVGRNIVVPYLKGKGITAVSKLLITHADADHMEGADEVLEELRVKEIHMPPGSEQEKTMQPLLELIEAQRIPVKLQKEGDGWSAGRYSFQYIAPGDEPYVGNDSSLVLAMHSSAAAFLFPGDIEKLGEQRIAQRYASADFTRVILKAAHHGSKTSTTEPFVRLLQPELAIISAGRNSRYGHPHAEVTERLTEHGVPFLTTAERGTIEIRAGSNGYIVSSSR